MTDETVTEQVEAPAEADTEADADATRAEIAAQGTEPGIEEEQQVAAEALPATEPDPEPEPGDDAEMEEPEEPVRKKKQTGYARLKIRAQAAIADNEALRRELDAIKSKDEAPQAPKLEDFDGDYDEYNRAITKFDMAEVVDSKLTEKEKSDAERRTKEAAQDAEDLFMEQLDAAREEKPDYDKALKSLHDEVGELNPGLVSLLQESDKGPDILYHLGKNPSKASRINGMGVIACAKEIGSLEAQLSVPKTKKTTKAPPPVTPVKGGGTPPPSNLEKIAASDDMDSYVAARKAM